MSSLNEKVVESHSYSADFLGFYHENCASTLELTYLEERGCKLYRKTLDEIKELGASFLVQIIHPMDIQNSFNRLLEFAHKGDEEELLCYSQRLKRSGTDSYDTYFTSVKLDKSKNIFQCVTAPVTNIPEFSGELLNRLNISGYIEKHTALYVSFTKREREVIALVCQGLSAIQIGKRLFLSPHTIEKHKKNINKKSGFISKNQLMEFSINFNLI